MCHELFVTEDGSHSIKLPAWNLTYHSKHGSILESQHVYIGAGLLHVLNDKTHISIFEMGFGTGLNALLTMITTQLLPVHIFYETVETDPVEQTTAEALNFTEILGMPGMQQYFVQLHDAEWNTVQSITKNFKLYKRSEGLVDVTPSTQYDVIYFDAFDPIAQPGLWTMEVFSKMYHYLNFGGVLVTYSSKSEVRKAMQKAGFSIEKLPGPKGKREMVRATKSHHLQ